MMNTVPEVCISALNVCLYLKKSKKKKWKHLGIIYFQCSLVPFNFYDVAANIVMELKLENWSELRYWYSFRS